MMIALLLRGILLGLGAAVPIGPVNVEIARRTLRGGFRDGFALGCGAVTIDVTYAIVVSIAMRRVMKFPNIVYALGLFGAALLAYLGIMCLRAAARASDAQPISGDVAAAPDGWKKAPAHRNYLTGILLTGLNPMTLAFWFTAVPGMAGAMTKDPRRDLPLICAGVFLATISWVCMFAGLMHWAGSFGQRGRWIRIADTGGGLLLLAFAVAMIWRVAKGFLS
jgi:L-lysine exporter family protein LysE/ArgO